MSDESEDRLVTLRECGNAFEAESLAIVLRDRGIDAWVFEHPGDLQMGSVSKIPLRVRASELEEAKSALEANIADSVDIDWDEVVGADGESSSSRSQRSGPRMPIAAKIGWLVAVILVILSLLAGGVILMYGP